MKNRVKLSAILFLLFAACTASYAAPKRPWHIEVKTDGGFSGRGAGDYALDSDAKVTARLMNGKACTFTISPEELARFETILGAARPERWKPSYVPEEACCDRFHYALTYDEAGTVRTTEWIDSPLPMPKDLVAVKDAIVGGEPSSVRMLANERCQ